MPGRFKADLKAIPAEYREPARAFAQDGDIPKDSLVLACAAGAFRNALKISPDVETLDAILTFFENHLPPFAWGSSLKMAHWEYLKKSMNSASAACLALVTFAGML